MQFAARRHISGTDELGNPSHGHLSPLFELQRHRCEEESLGRLWLLRIAGHLAGRSHCGLCNRKVIYFMSHLSLLCFNKR